MIPRRITAAFPPDVQRRGEQYFKSQRVRLVRASAVKLTTMVAGTTGYLIEITAEPGLMTATCSCPYAADNGVCKHIWATLRFAEVGRQLEALVKTAGKNTSFETLGDEEPEDFEDEDYDDEDFGDEDFGDELPALFDTEAATPPLRTSAAPPAARRPTPNPRAPVVKERAPEWKTLLDGARQSMRHPASYDAPAEWPADRRLVYLVDLDATWRSKGLVVELATERLARDGTWAPPVQYRLSSDAWHASPDPRDRQIAQMLVGAPSPSPYDYYAGRRTPGQFVLDGPAIAVVLPLMCETGRCRVRQEFGERPLDAVHFDAGPPWTMHVQVTRAKRGGFVANAILRRPGEEMPIGEPSMLHAAGVLLARDSFARFQCGSAFPLVSLFREKPEIVVREPEIPAFLESLYSLPRRPDIVLPSEMSVSELHAAPQPGVVIHPDPSPWRTTHHRLEPFFLYGPVRVDEAQQNATPTSIFDRATLTIHHRDHANEAAAVARLRELGAKDEWHRPLNAKCLAVRRNKLGSIVADLTRAGWRVEADGVAFRAPGDIRASVRSGIDWFELSASVLYGDVEVSLHDLLAARRRGATSIELPGGDQGLMPTDLLARVGPLAAGGVVSADARSLRFTRSQTGLIDALVAALPEPDVDAAFEQARAELRAFDRVAPADAPPTFRGALREYQREGLGWLDFLRRFGLGGCLADDMGLGKTIQVLALLDARRTCPDGEKRPSLVVVPRSLVFNWLREAERFAPELSMLDYTGSARRVEDIAPGRVVVTTYGTLRRDVAQLAAIQFDYAILDEAQAIKSSGSAAAKAACLLRADHRLAMTGTPIENRLEELWSLFEFLNPGMLGAATTFGALVRLSRAESGSSSADRSALAHALRPVILRRTKAQVAPELPARIEQTLHVELEKAQRKFYNGLLESYRRSVLERVDRVGVGKARMHILEALLRLRQAACHPGLADPRKTNAASAKLDALLPTLEEVTAEGHKALVFSQFTSFLALLRRRLDAAGTTYEYLDGKTRDRAARVDRFQTDPACSLFLISLKAGGHGLNLTAAEHVFILDPWWNPAVEAQAMDRAHRIGQTRQVMATRIVARDTIEEKILELQASKRALADAILGQDQGVLSGIGRVELEMLLS